MKIAIIGSNSYDSLEYNLQESFIFNGHKCDIFDIYEHWYYQNRYLNKYTKIIDWMGRRFSDKYDKHVFTNILHNVIAYNPDLVIGVYRFIHPSFVKIIKENNIKIIHINPDQLTTFEYQQLFVEPYDTYFTKDPYIQNFMSKNLKLNTLLYFEAFNSRLHKKPEIDKETCEKEIDIDVTTYGTIYPYRSRMLSYLNQEGIKLTIYGTRPNRFYNADLNLNFQNKYITGAEKSKILYGSKIVFNQMHYAEIESVNNRFFEVNGAGAFQLSDYKPILKELLPIDPELVSFKSIDEGIEKVKFYLSHPSERYRIAEKVYAHFLNHYTYDHLIKYILKNI